jgi:signal peptidase II
MEARSRYLWGPLTGFGLAAAAVAGALDQASKLWLLFAFRLAERGAVTVAPFVDLVLTWNTGISYGWFQQEGPLGQWALLGLKAVAVALLWIWLARAVPADGAGVDHHRRSDGNAIDRLTYGAVADFVLLHLETASGRFNWYVFNLADVAIVAGVAVLLYESLWGDGAPKPPRSRR